MSHDRRSTQDLQDAPELVALRQEGGANSFVHPKRRRSPAPVAVIVDPPPEREFQDDVPTIDLRTRGTAPPGALAETAARLQSEIDEEESRPTRRFTPALLAQLAAPPPARAHAPYRDPDLCACARMMEALDAKVVMVVVAGPVTLSPAVLREDVLLKGDLDVARIDWAYDGKTWAFRHCPFEGTLIDPQVEILAQTDRMTCCGTMALAVAHGRVTLPPPERLDRVMAKFTDAERPALMFAHCPWCATEILDLVIARHKRSRGL